MLGLGVDDIRIGGIDGAEEAVATDRKAAPDPDLAGLLELFGCSERLLPRWKRNGGAISGLAEDGSEIVSVPILEPSRVLEAYDAALRAARTNIP